MHDRPLRVGLILPFVGAKVGGGYVFGREIIGALSRLKESNSADFYLLLHEGLEDPGINLPILSLRKKFARPWVKGLVDCFAAARLQVNRPLPTWTANGHPLHQKVDVIICLYPGVLEGADVPQVSTIWDLSHRYIPGFPELSHGVERSNREEKFKKIIFHADYFITGTQRGVHELQLYYGVDDRRIFVIPHPTPSDALCAAKQKPELLAAIREPFAIFPAQLWPHKNHQTLLRSWQALCRDSNWGLRLVCPGSDYGMRNWLVGEARRLGIEHMTEFPGFLVREELLALYSRASMALYPSLFGPENLPPLEAFALGCPVIASDIPGAKEQLGEAALLVDPLDHEAWANSARLLSSDNRLRAELIERGYQRAAERSPEHFAHKIVVMLGEIGKLRLLWPRASSA